MEDLIKLQYLTIRNAETFMINYRKDGADRRGKSLYYTTRLNNLGDYWKDFKKRHQEIVLAATDKEQENASYFLDERYSKFEEFYIDAYTRIVTESERDHPTKESSVKVEEKGDKTIVHVHSTRDEIKLPKVSLPTFSGDYLAWTPFYDMFLSLVHNNDHVSPVQKMQYLKAHLSGEAKNLLNNTPITAANYERAWNTLVARYENKRILVKAQLDVLLGQPVVKLESANGIKGLLDKTSESLAALQNLNVETSSWDPIVVHVIGQRLPYETSALWEQSLGSKVELPSWDELRQFLEARFRTLEAITPKRRPPPTEYKPTNQPDRSWRRPQTFHVITGPACQICHESHVLRQCPKYLGYDHQTKLDLIKSKGLCLNCLGTGHLAAKCPSKSKCFICKRSHHTTLHKEQSTAEIQDTHIEPEQSSKHAFATQASISTNSSTEHSATQCFLVNQPSMSEHVLLATALVTISSPNGRKEVCRALIDPCSQTSFVTEHLVQFLGLNREEIDATIHGVYNIPSSRITSCTRLVLTPRDMEGNSVQVNALIVTKVTNVLPNQRIRKGNWKHLKDLPLADPTFDRPGTVDVLLGADVYPLIIEEGLRKGKPGTPVAQRTIFGWILSGQTSPHGCETSNMKTFHVNLSLSYDLKQFWELEELPVTNQLTKEEERCEQHFIETHKRGDDGRYQVRLPFENHPVKLGASRNMAIVRMIQLEKRFTQDPFLKEEYQKCLKEYLDLKHMEPVNNTETSFMQRDENNDMYFNCAYLPHHAVLKLSSSSTKVRVVFDASRRTSKGKSLTDILLKGPTIQESLFAILMRWRKYKVALTADIHKMYRQIRMHPEDTDYQRIIWRESPDQPFQDYRLSTVTFGTKSAPYLAIRTMQQLAKDEYANYPIGAEAVLTEFYVDDLISGADSPEEAGIKQHQIHCLLESGGLELRKWASTSETVLQHIPIEHREVNLTVPIKSEAIKTLGIFWSPSTDHLWYKLQMETKPQTWTKRTVLSDVAKLFDPIGWLSPVTIQAKILIQSLWLAGIQWDEEIPKNLEAHWTGYRESLLTLERIQIPRWIQTGPTAVRIDLHGFCDASMKAYAAAVYARVQQINGDVNVHLISAKTKVAPIKTISLPKLELCGAALLAKLMIQVKKDIQLSINDMYAWTDSKIVLAWLKKHPSNWETFIGNRVSNIQQLLGENLWKHVPSESNPADCASRGVTPEQLKEHALWWQGPHWLKEPKEYWPKSCDIETAIGLRKKIAALHVQICETNHLLERFSSLSRLIRVTAYCQRWISKVRNLPHTHNENYLTTEELRKALTLWTQMAQREHFMSEITALQSQAQISNKSTLRKLNPFLDDHGLIRVGGRLKNALISYDERHPIVLPERNHLTTLIIKDVHHKTMHGGSQLMLSLLHRQYWIINARNAVRKHIHRCINCFRQTAQTRTQLMADLPGCRVQQARPFAHCGVDYCGPFNLKSSKGRGVRSYKAYIAVFVCMTIKAIHLEVVSDLSTPGFLAAFRRFVSRRGLCTDIYSDCGSNFIGANSILTRYKFEMVQQQESEIAQAIENQGIRWHFIPPSSPHFGGLWESGVKSVKTHLKKVISNALLTFEEFTTLLTQIEASLNSRPLTEMSQDPQDISALTPGHFLVGGPILMPPEPTVLDLNISYLDRYRYVQRLLQTFWNRWSSDYLRRLQQRPKWLKGRPNVEKDELVLIKDDRLPPSQWLMGRIMDTHPGKDDLIRVVTLRTQHNVIKRPITKICPLPISYPDKPVPKSIH